MWRIARTKKWVRAQAHVACTVPHTWLHAPNYTMPVRRAAIGLFVFLTLHSAA